MRATTFDSRCRSARRSSVVGLSGIVVAALLLLSPPLVRADDTWTLTTTGDWSVATDWSGGVPTASSTADIFNGGSSGRQFRGSPYITLHGNG
jgi:hypothetical protein